MYKRPNAGELSDKIEILSLTNSGVLYTWNAAVYAYAKAERLNSNNIFSSVGLGARSVKFTVRKTDLTLHNAIRWKGKHCFLTDIIEIDRAFIEVTAALIEPKTCIVRRDGEPTLNALNNPVYGEPTLISFPACLTEKYLGRTQMDPMAVVETRYVLVAPKCITLEEGELVIIESASYEVLLCHTLDDHKNEYEISWRGDA